MNRSDPVDVLARVVWGEARDQGKAGMTAVAAVVLNRAHDGGWWGHDILSVCLHPEQFSCLNPGDPNLPKLEAVTGSDPQFVTALAIADAAVNGKLVDPTNGADSYYRTGSEVPDWSFGLEPCAIIGAHRFYKTRPPMPKFMDDPAAVAEA